MSTKKTQRKGKSPEQRRAEVQELHAQLTAQVQELTTSEGWMRWLRFVQSFHTYSFRNALLILAQCPHASQIAGYRKWQEHGRQVRKGQKGIKILGYSRKKVTETDSETGEESERYISRFPVLTVFDVSQTEGEDLPTPGAERLVGDDEQGIKAAVFEWLRSQGWTVEEESIPGEVNGTTFMDTRRVVVDSGLSAAQAAKTALHEAGHVLLHSDPEIRGERSRDVLEVEAESVAFIVAGALGVDTSAYSVGYVAGWGEGDPQVLQDTAERVLRAAQTALKGIEAVGVRSEVVGV